MLNAECRMPNEGTRSAPAETRGLSSRQGLFGNFAAKSKASRGISPRAARHRRGISLLETLFAIFVTAIGILSLASLIPVAKFLITQAERADRGTAVADAAMNEAINRGLVQVLPTVAPGQDFAVVDPWLRSRGDLPAQTAIGTVTIDNFPYDSAATSPNFPSTTTSPPRPLRITAFPALVGTAAHRPAADRFFTSNDDLVFSEPARAELRPQQVAAGAYQGDYSWLATIAVAPSQRLRIAGPPTTANPTGVIVQTPTLYTLSVAVFHKRGLPPVDANDKAPTERIVLVDFLGGGDVRFRVPTGTDNAFLKMRPNQWIMIAGWEATGGALDIPEPPAPPAPPDTPQYIDPVQTTSAGTGRNRGVVKWYRIAAIGDQKTETVGTPLSTDPNLETIGTNNWRVRYATLAGPDWGNGTSNFDTDSDGLPDILYDADSDNTTGIMTLHAYLLTDCIAVVERTVKFDPVSMQAN